jgi:hypothetical protein
VSYASIHADVLVVDGNGNTIEKVGDELVSWEKTVVRKKDEYKQVLGDGNARVTVSISEKIGARSYSNLSVHVSVTLRCNQDAETIRAAEDLAFQEAVAFMDDTVDRAYQLLTVHLDRIVPEE